MRSRSPKSKHFFPMFQWCFCATLVKIHQLVQEIRLQTRLIFTVCIVWWPWKLDQGHQNLIKSLNHFNIKPSQCYNRWSLARICHLVQETGCTQAFFGQNFKVLVWPWKLSKGHQNLITSFLPPNNVSVQVWSKSMHWFRDKSADNEQCRRDLHQKQYVSPPLRLRGHNHENEW